MIIRREFNKKFQDVSSYLRAFCIWIRTGLHLRLFFIIILFLTIFLFKKYNLIGLSTARQYNAGVLTWLWNEQHIHTDVCNAFYTTTKKRSHCRMIRANYTSRHPAHEARSSRNSLKRWWQFQISKKIRVFFFYFLGFYRQFEKKGKQILFVEGIWFCLFPFLLIPN